MSIGIINIVEVYNKNYLDLSPNERLIYFNNIKQILKKMEKIKKI